jgi:outer membrane lipoprotein carrier protein
MNALLIYFVFLAANAPSLAAAPSSKPPLAVKDTKATSGGTATVTPVVDLAQIIARMQKRYDQAKDFRASFSQTYSRAIMKRVTVSTGRVVFKKSGRMRWDYETPEPRMFLSNGQVLWLFEPTEKQAFKQDLKSSQLPAALAFLMGKGKLTDEFEVTLVSGSKHGRPRDVVLSLRPKQPQTTYQSILFVVDSKEYLVRESILVDAQGNTNHFVFDDLKVNTKVDDALFKWSPPIGIRVVDTGKL